VGSIHQHTLSTEALQVICQLINLDKLCWLDAGVDEFPPIVQLFTVRASHDTSSKRCEQHPGNIGWLPRPVRALYLRVKWCSSFHPLTYGKRAIFGCSSSLPEKKQPAPSPFASPVPICVMCPWGPRAHDVQLGSSLVDYLMGRLSQMFWSGPSV